MKHLLSFFAFFIISFNSTAQVKKFDRAGDYNDFIIDEQKKISEKINEFASIYGDSKDSNLVHEARKKIILQADSSVKNLKHLASFKGDSGFRNSAINLFAFYAQVAADEYTQMVRLGFDTRKSSDDLSKEMKALLETVTSKEKIYDAAFQGAQKAFAARYNIKLE